MSDSLVWLLSETHADVWAREFCKRFIISTDEGAVQDQEGLMLSWFANAIETGRRAGMASGG